MVVFLKNLYKPVDDNKIKLIIKCYLHDKIYHVRLNIITYIVCVYYLRGFQIDFKFDSYLE